MLQDDVCVIATVTGAYQLIQKGVSVCLAYTRAGSRAPNFSMSMPS
jgi:hypothetical protein